MKAKRICHHINNTLQRRSHYLIRFKKHFAKASESRTRSNDIVSVDAIIIENNESAEHMKDGKYHTQQIADLRVALSDQEKQTNDILKQQYLSLLEVVDAFERILDNIDTKKELCTPQMNIWLGNFMSVYRRLGRVLKEQGVVAIDNLHLGFDPHWHSIAEKIYDPSHPEGTIIKEIRRGYLWRGMVLRHSEVMVTTSESIHEMR